MTDTKTAEEYAEELGMGSHDYERAILEALKAHAAEARRDERKRIMKQWVDSIEAYEAEQLGDSDG